MVMGDMEMRVDLAVIGAGPAGIAAALRAASLGLDVALIDRQEAVGGHYLHNRTFPLCLASQSAAQIHHASLLTKQGIHFRPPKIDLNEFRSHIRKQTGDTAAILQKLCDKKGILVVRGHGNFTSSNRLRIDGGSINHLRFENAILATGRQQLLSPPFTAAKKRIFGLDGFLFPTVFPETLLIESSDSAGLEIGCIFSALGCQVQLATTRQTLLQEADDDLAKFYERQIEPRFTRIFRNTRITELSDSENYVDVRLDHSGKSHSERFDMVLTTEGYQPVVSDMGLDNTGISIGAGGKLVVDDKQRTTVPNIYGAGTITGHPSCPRRAIHEGIIAAEAIAGLPSSYDIRALPYLVRSDPQVGWCGITEDQAGKMDIPVRTVQHDWDLSLTRYFTGGKPGMTKMVFERESGRLLGMAVVGSNIETIISEGCLAIEMGCLADDMALTMRPQPSPASLTAELAGLVDTFSMIETL